MFRIVCDPSSGSIELCLTEITLSGSQIFFECLVGVWQRNFEPAVRTGSLNAITIEFGLQRLKWSAKQPAPQLLPKCAPWITRDPRPVPR